MTDLKITEVPVEEDLNPQKPDKRKIRSPKQVEALAAARAKAMEIRKANAELTRKSREIKKIQREEKKQEIERLYDAMIAKKNKPPTPPEEKPTPPPPEPEPEDKPPPELVHQPTPEPETRPPSPEPIVYPDPPKPVYNKHMVKKQSTSKPIAIPQPKPQPPAYKSAFENYLGYY